MIQIQNRQATGMNIAYIGGGSRGWAWGLMSDLASCPDMSGDVYLYDIDFEAAKNNEIIGNKYIPPTLGTTALRFQGQNLIFGQISHRKPPLLSNGLASLTVSTTHL